MNELIKSWIRTIVFFLCVVSFIFIMGSYFRLSAQVIELGALGRSMLPTLREGDITITQQVDPNLIEVGDVIVFYPSLEIVPRVHRVIKKVVEDSKIYFYTQGDNSLYPDPPTPSDRIIGKVILVVPKIGLIRLYLSPPTGIFLIILLIILSLLYDYLTWKRSKMSLDFKSPNSKKLNE